MNEQYDNEDPYNAPVDIFDDSKTGVRIVVSDVEIKKFYDNNPRYRFVKSYPTRYAYEDHKNAFKCV